MPLPSRNKGEEKSKFVSRCMSNPQAKKDFPKQKQRVAVCNSRASREQVEYTEDELEALATVVKVSTINPEKEKKFKRKKDRFRKVRDEEVGSSVTGKKPKAKKKKKKKSTPY